MTPRSKSYTRSINPVSTAHSRCSFRLNSDRASESSSRLRSVSHTVARESSSFCAKAAGSFS